MTKEKTPTSKPLDAISASYGLYQPMVTLTLDPHRTFSNFNSGTITLLPED